MLANIAHQHLLANMLVRFAICEQHVGDGKTIKKCWPTFINFFINVGQHCWLSMHVGTVCYPPPTYWPTFQPTFSFSNVFSNYFLRFRMLFPMLLVLSNILYLVFKMAEKNASKVEKKHRWEDEELGQLIDLYEERPCLWDIAEKNYAKRDIKEKAISEISVELNIDIPTIKAKWNSLRAQHGRELAKENKTKSGQSTDEIYESSWPYMEKMRFVEQIKKTAKSTSTLKLSSGNDADNDLNINSDPEESLDTTEFVKEKSSKRKRITQSDEKQKLIAKCINVLDKPATQPQPTVTDPFALYVSEQLKDLDKRRRLIAEKRINDILFEIRFEQFSGTSSFSGMQPQPSFGNHLENAASLWQTPQIPQQGAFTAMLKEF